MLVPPSLPRPQTSTLPACFGESWGKDDPECKGGYDPTYRHPATGQPIRPACDFFAACGARTQAKQALVPPERLVQGGAASAPAAASATVLPSPAPLHTFLSQAAARLPPALATPQAPPGAMVPVRHSAQTYELNYLVPAYLTVPEPRLPGESLWHVLLREALRASIKAVAHAIAHHVDLHPFRHPPPR